MFDSKVYLCNMSSHSGPCNAVTTVLMNRLCIPEDDAWSRSLSGAYVHGYEMLERKMGSNLHADIPWQ